MEIELLRKLATGGLQKNRVTLSSVLIQRHVLEVIVLMIYLANANKVTREFFALCVKLVIKEMIILIARNARPYGRVCYR